ncbi:NAD(+) diphosphatase [uncultured Aeromicrobium sp.]|uniref:NAD(+) diphosphatase n=1 Tax=uncultured Aeromicrobium sp. TaxID=337820 RepID=UPI0025F6A94B|nr:NAD(+) diphosphatase [uncultured Aeromicrobium sp.]
MDFAFDRARHDRQGNRRHDDTWKDDPGLRVLVVGGEHVPTDDGPALRWLSRDEAPDGTWLLLGESQGVTHAAVVVDRVGEDLAPTSVRILAPLLKPDELSLAIHAVAMARWLRSHRFCARCGSALDVAESGHLLTCPECGAHHFPRTDPAVIMLITDDHDRALLARNAAWPERRYSTLAGFVEPGEALEDAVRREVREEVGLVVGDVSYAGSQPWPFPSSLMLGFFGRADSSDIVVDDNEIAHARWFTRDELAAAIDVEDIILPPPHVSISRWLIDSWLSGPVSP